MIEALFLSAELLMMLLVLWGVVKHDKDNRSMGLGIFDYIENTEQEKSVKPKRPPHA